MDLRAEVLTRTRELLADGKPRMAKEIAAELLKRGLAGVDKSLVNSVLAVEGKGQFSYDRTSYAYTLAGADGQPPATPPTDGAATASPKPQREPADPALRQRVLVATRELLTDGKQRMSKEIAAELARRGVQADKSLVNSVLAVEGKGQFSYDREKYTYTLNQEAQRG